MIPFYLLLREQTLRGRETTAFWRNYGRPRQTPGRIFSHSVLRIEVRILRLLQSAGQGQAHALLSGRAADPVAGNDAPHDRLFHRHGVFRRRHAELLRRPAHRGDPAGAEGHQPADEAASGARSSACCARRA